MTSLANLQSLKDFSNQIVLILSAKQLFLNVVSHASNKHIEKVFHSIIWPNCLRYDINLSDKVLHKFVYFVAYY